MLLKSYYMYLYLLEIALSFQLCVFPPRGCVAMSGHIYDCPVVGQARDAAQPSTVSSTDPHHREMSSQVSVVPRLRNLALRNAQNQNCPGQSEISGQPIHKE